MKRTVFLLALALIVSPCLAGGQDNERQKEPATYQSPILSLLFLPANLLIKMASVFGPEEAPKQSKPERPAAKVDSPR
jgi:hypothetical protein